MCLVENECDVGDVDGIGTEEMLMALEEADEIEEEDDVVVVVDKTEDKD